MTTNEDSLRKRVAALIEANRGSSSKAKRRLVAELEALLVAPQPDARDE